MNTPKVEMLRQTLMSIQMHAAGMGASAEMAMRLLAEIRGAAPSPGERQGPMAGGRPVAHYGDPLPDPDQTPADMEQVFTELERNGGIAPNPANGGESTSAQE